MSEHYCKNCDKSYDDGHCKWTGALHTTGIECPSFKQKKSEVFKVADRVRVIAGEKRLIELSLGGMSLTGTVGRITRFTTSKKEPIRVAFDARDDGEWGLATRDLELVEEEYIVGVDLAVPGSDYIAIRTFESGAKDTNPKDALAGKKAPLSTLPTAVMYDVALAMLEGARKYGRHNYRVMGVLASVYYDAAMGHITSWWEGEDIDAKSGLHHLDKAMASLAVVRDGIHMENWVDDRPPKYPDSSKMMRDHPAVAIILENYPDCVEPYTEENKEVDRTAPTKGGY